MHECPWCGMACDCDEEDIWVGWPANLDCTHCPDGETDDSDDVPGLYPYQEEPDDVETTCAECGRPGIDQCQCCGAPLCAMHSEIGAGFCRSCPTLDWIAEQEETNERD